MGLLSNQGVHDAAAEGNLSAVRRLLRAGESPNAAWISGWNALPYLLISRAPAADRQRVAAYLLAGDHLHVAPLATKAAVATRGLGGLAAITEQASRHQLPRIKLAAYVWRYELLILRRAAEAKGEGVPTSVPTAPPSMPRSATQADHDWLAASIAIHWIGHPVAASIFAALGAAAASTPPAAAAASSAGATTRGRPGRAGAVDWREQADALADRALAGAARLPRRKPEPPTPVAMVVDQAPPDPDWWRKELAAVPEEHARRRREKSAAARWQRSAVALAKEALARVSSRSGVMPPTTKTEFRPAEPDMIDIDEMMRAIGLPVRDDVIKTILSDRRPEPKAGARGVTVFECFAGGGLFGIGIDAAIMEAGCRPHRVGYCELSDKPAGVYRLNFGEVTRYRDAKLIANGKLGAPLTRRERTFRDVVSAEAGRHEEDAIDVIVGGPPCQDFSWIRKHIKVRNAKKINLYPTMVRLVEVLQPRLALIENVPPSADNPKVQAALAHLATRGYHVSTQVVCAADYGTPQNRERFLAVAIRKDVATTAFSFAAMRRVFGTRRHGAGEVLAIEQPGQRETYGKRHGKAGIQARWVARHGSKAIPDELLAPRQARLRTLHGGVLRRMDPDLPAPALTRNFHSVANGQFLHPFEDRGLSLLEGRRLQGLPDWYQLPHDLSDSAARLLIANGAPPQFSRSVVGLGFRMGLFRPILRVGSDDVAERLCRDVMAMARTGRSTREIKVISGIGGRTFDGLAAGGGSHGLKNWRTVCAILAVTGLKLAVDAGTPARSPVDLAAAIQTALRQRVPAIATIRGIRNRTHLSYASVTRWISGKPADLGVVLGPLARVAHTVGVGIAVVPAR